MRLFVEPVTVFMALAALYWVVSDLNTEKTCLYTVEINDMIIQSWDSCGLTQKEVISNMKVDK